MRSPNARFFAKWIAVGTVIVVALMSVYLARVIIEIRYPRMYRVAQNYVGKSFSELEAEIGEPDVTVLTKDMLAGTAVFPIPNYDKPEYLPLYKAFVYYIDSSPSLIYVYVDESDTITHMYLAWYRRPS